MDEFKEIRSWLFGEDSTVPLKTVESILCRGLGPDYINKFNCKMWRHTFVGDFVYHYTKDYGIACIVCKVLGKNDPGLWDFTEENLNKIVAELNKRAPNTAKEYASKIKTTITRLLESDECDQFVGCKHYAKILTLDGCPTTKPYMGLDDLKRFMQYKPESKAEEYCKALFAVMLMTGARHSDVINFKTTNIQDGVLTYVPKKTKFSGTVVSIPVSDTIIEYIKYIENNKCRATLAWFNTLIKQICKKCGLTEEVTYFYGGKSITKPKYEAMRSHLGRTSFVTNMLKLGLGIHEVSKLAGHTDVVMTSRYNASNEVELTEKAKDFINLKF